MKKLLLAFSLLVFSMAAISQDGGRVKSASIGLNFFLNDFVTAANIRSNSLSSTLLNKQFGKLKTMSAGLGINYVKGLSSNLDFSSSIGGSFLDYTTASGKKLGSNSFLVELDASLHAKMLPDNYLVVPYLSAGIGMSKYKGYYGAIMPVGVGLQINIFSNTFIMIGSQYRIKVTESTNYHFLHSIGIIGSLETL